ncbi:MAG: HAMP domain-containing histidine kinase [Oscillospiraceae bacterium]|jgi:signal transduction histidine kinase|nr:HAMP domain-containing histidine kinase [Oscillospiraceae bacterium]
MKKLLSRFTGKYFDPGLDLRVQAFNLLACGGIAAGAVAALSAVLTGVGVFNVALNLAASATAFILLHFARRTGRYGFCFLFTVVAVFYIAFPFLFFTSGGYRGGMPCWFMFAVVFTALMLEGAVRAVCIVGELVFYAVCCFIAYYYPETVTPFPSELDALADIFVGIFAAGLILLTVVLLYIRIYNNRQERLLELDKLKTEFYQDMHHEMKTPLTVISSDIQTADDMMDFSMDKDYIREKLEHAQEEIIRLARMVENSLDLASAQVGKSHMEPIDFAALLRTNAEAFRPLLEKNGNILSVNVPDGLPKLTGSRDMLVQVIYNIIENAAKYTRNGEIAVSLKRTGCGLETVIRDTGEGIAPELLPRVWERGVASRGTGYGLSICKTFVEEMHGGHIRIESEPGKGTVVTFTLPLYNGELRMESGE